MIRYLHSRRWVAKCFLKWLDDCENKNICLWCILKRLSVFPVSCTKKPKPVCSLVKVLDKILGVGEGLGRWKPGLSRQYYRTCYYSTAQMRPGYPQGGLCLGHHITDSESTHSKGEWADVTFWKLLRPCNTSCCFNFIWFTASSGFRTVFQNLLWK